MSDRCPLGYLFLSPPPAVINSHMVKLYKGNSCQIDNAKKVQKFMTPEKTAVLTLSAPNLYENAITSAKFILGKTQIFGEK